jgi:TolA-binding protein
LRRADASPERTDLDVARAALARGRPDACLSTLEAHAKAYPRSAYAEERESLWIQALAAAGRLGEAQSRFQSFRRAYPSSLFTPALETSLRRETQEEGLGERR